MGNGEDGESRGGGVGERAPWSTCGVSTRLLFVLFLFAISAISPFPQSDAAADRPPDVAAPQPIVLPVPAVRVLPNGLTVLVVERHSLPLVTLHLEVKAGAEADPPDRPGVAQFVASMLDEGTARRSALEIAATIDGVGGTLDSGADWDESYGAVTVLVDHTTLAFDLLSDMILHPAFVPAEIERTRKQTLSALDVLRDDPASVADTVFDRVIFDGTPYSHPADGTAEAVRGFSAADLEAFHNRMYRPANSILAIVGDVAPATAFEQAAKYFGGWTNPAEPVTPLAPAARADEGSGSAPEKPGREVVVIDKPDAVQTEIRIGNAAIRRASPDYDALTVANQILGGPASNRLFGALRSERGLTYGASSDLICHRTFGSWEAKTSTRTAETAKTVHLVLEQMKRLRDHAISGEELETAQHYLIGHEALDFETADDVASQFLDLALHNLPLDDWNRFPQRLHALIPDDVFNAIGRYLDPDRATIVLVGNAAVFAKDLKKLGPVRVIPLAKLNLGKPLETGRR